MMNKNSAENKVCIHCNKDALPNTDPPVCEEHLLSKKASEEGEAENLKELDAKD